MKRALSLVALVVTAAASLASVGSVARADTPPTRWDAVKDPKARSRFALHSRVRELLLLDARMTVGSLRNMALDRARILLEQSGAATSADVRLRFDLGEVYELLGRHEQAVTVLKAAIAAAPDHPAAPDAIVTLAYAHAKLGHSVQERDAYRMYLARITSDRSRSTALLNMAEAEMHLGNLDEAVEGYKDALASAAQVPNSGETQALAVWGLAVALDRSGDPQGAMEQASRATRMDVDERIIAHSPNVFFVPEHERAWYLALAEMVHARNVSTAIERAQHLSAAAAHWSHYVTSASATDASDPFLRLARAHLARTQVQLHDAEARAKNAPAAKTDAKRLSIPIPY